MLGKKGEAPQWRKRTSYVTLNKMLHVPGLGLIIYKMGIKRPPQWTL